LRKIGTEKDVVPAGWIEGFRLPLSLFTKYE